MGVEDIPDMGIFKISHMKILPFTINKIIFDWNS